MGDAAAGAFADLAAAGAAAAQRAGAAALRQVLSPSVSQSAVPAPLVVTEERLAQELRALNLELGDRLGKGSRATVFSAVGCAAPSTAAAAPAGAWRAPPGARFAVKALLGDVSADAQAELASEARLWAAPELVAHPGVVTLHAASLSPAPLLVLEACPGGTLFAALRRGDPLDIRALGLDVARALAAVHAAGQAHRDIKSANVLLSGSPGAWRAKLCDWGSAAPANDPVPARPPALAWPAALLGGRGGGAAASWTPVGTLLWMAPEMLLPHEEGSAPPPGATGAAADVYSFGIFLWELLERRLPWTESVPVTRSNVQRCVAKEGKRLPPPAWAHPELVKLMTACWAADPRDRPGMSEVVERLEALQKWDTNGHLEKVKQGLPHPQAPVNGAAVAPGVKAAVAARATAPVQLNEEALIQSERRESRATQGRVAASPQADKAKEKARHHARLRACQAPLTRLFRFFCRSWLSPSRPRSARLAAATPQRRRVRGGVPS